MEMLFTILKWVSYDRQEGQKETGAEQRALEESPRKMCMMMGQQPTHIIHSCSLKRLNCSLKRNFATCCSLDQRVIRMRCL